MAYFIHCSVRPQIKMVNRAYYSMYTQQPEKKRRMKKYPSGNRKQHRGNVLGFV